MNSALRRIHVANALSSFGPGFTSPFLYVYVAQVRGLGALTAGLVLAAFAVAALLVLPFAGRAIVRWGPQPVLLAAVAVAGVGALILGVATSAPAVLASAAVLGAGQAVTSPALATLIVDCSSTRSRSRAFAMQFFLQNIGAGLGGLLGGHLADPARPGTFTTLFLAEAGLSVIMAAAVATVRVPRAPRIEQLRSPAAGSWRHLLRNQAMVQLCVLGFVLFFACYGQFESGLTAYGLQIARISPATLGNALAVNTAVIVAAQFAVLRVVERRQRTRVIAAVGIVWALAWAFAGWAGLAPGGSRTATIAFLSTYALFGLGEAMLSPTLAPLVADVAPEGLAGQYNSAFSLVKQLALAIGPAIGGPLGALLPAPYIAVFLLVSLAVTVLAVRLGRHLTVEQNRPLAAEAVAA
jgi:MFS family permease